MKKHLPILFLFATVFFVPQYLSSQTDTSKVPQEVIINGKRYKAVDDKKVEPSKKIKIKKIVDSVFVINNKKFQYYNNWLTIGAGAQQNLSYKRELGFAGGLDFSFHIKKNYFQAGILITGLRFGSYNNYQFHAGYGKRFEDKDLHFAVFIGASYSSGIQTTQIDSAKYIRKPYSHPGIYAQGEVVKKITYDVGVGASLFADINKEQDIIGLRFVLYFSGAYKGKKNKQYEDY